MASPLTRTKVFISYSHENQEWLERLKRHLKPLVREGSLDCWDATHIHPGDDWQQEIRTALDTAQAAVLLISADFFASDFIDETELPPLLTAAQEQGVRVLPLILSASRFARDPNLARFQAVNSLNEMPEGEQERVLQRLAQTIESTLNRS
jgi:TIR domain